MAASRLFDCLRINLTDASIPDMLAAKENGVWRKYGTAEVFQLVNDQSAGLLKLGLGAGDASYEGRDKISIIAKSRPEWVITDLAVQQIGAVLIPIYPTINVSELKFILSDAKVKLLFLNDEQLFEKINEIKADLPDLKYIYSFEKIEEVPHWTSLLINDREWHTQVELISSKIKGSDLATIIYTSGTTGRPKGVMLSHNNILSNVIESSKCLPEDKNLKALSFLPLNHIFEKMITYLHLYNGTAIYYAESFEKIADNLKEIKPQLFSTVPRLLEKVYEKIMLKGRELKGIKKILFFKAHNIATRYEINTNQGFLYNLQLSLANKIIFNKWREALGNNIICIVSGGAACQVRLIRIFTAARINILEGYGLTETSPVISVNRMNVKDRCFGTVGPLIDNVEVKFEEDGEILCKGPNVMIGYYKNAQLTEESINNGWYKTGDIGKMVEGKFLKITDRKKEIFKTSGGKYVAPMFIENKLKESRYIENAMVIGAGEKFVGALIIPSFPNLQLWCKESNIKFTSPLEMIKQTEILNFYKSLINGLNSNFNHVEQIKKFELLPVDWSVETGELTPKLSLKRKVIEEKYSSYISRIYNQS